MKNKYDKEFYQDRDARTRYAANRIVEIAVDLVKPGSVVDLGCGVGTWLSVFKEHGIGEILGIEGPWLNQENLVIDSAEFESRDLTAPLNIDKTFDLAMSLEVAEHLDEQYAGTFVDHLTGLAPVILFSAAVPLQGGVNHVNEQWPSYWRELFEERGYIWIDAVRPQVWDDPRIAVWYAQNTGIYVRSTEISNYPALKALEGVNSNMIDAINPRMYVSKMRGYSLTKWLKNKRGKLI